MEKKGFHPGVYLGIGSLGDTRPETAEFRIQDSRISDVELLNLLTETFPQGKFWIQFENMFCYFGALSNLHLEIY